MVSPYAVESVGGAASAGRVCWVGVCSILSGRMACVGIIYVCRRVVSLGVSLVGSGIVSIPVVDVLWSCAMEGLM